MERYEFDAIISPQDPSEYYLPPFKTCAVDKNVSSFMCSYNAINGIPMCANSYFLEDILRKHWGWEADDLYVVTDCDCVPLMVSSHKYVDDVGKAAAVVMKAGTDLECNNSVDSNPLHRAWNQSLIVEEEVDKALSRLWTGLVGLGLFDSGEEDPLRSLGWKDVNTPEAQRLAYRAAVDGMVLVKNDGILPLSLNDIISYALVGPWVNVTSQLQGIYSGPAPYLISPLKAADELGLNHEFALGTRINAIDSSFQQALSAASAVEVAIYMGGVDSTLESEGSDRTNLKWPRAQQELLDALIKLDKPLIVVKFGASQVDDTELPQSDAVKSLIWAGLPGQSGGKALLDIIFGNTAPAGRMPITQYPASYADLVPAADMNLRPAKGNANLGQTHMWYNGPTPIPFGHGLHYTKFSAQLGSPSLDNGTSIDELLGTPYSGNQIKASWHEVLEKKALSITVTVTNEGDVESDYVALLFLKSNATPEPRPLKTLVSYSRLRGIAPGQSKDAVLAVDIERLARVESNGDKVLYPGDYEVFIDPDAKASYKFSLLGDLQTVETFPAQRD